MTSVLSSIFCIFITLHFTKMVNGIAHRNRQAASFLPCTVYLFVVLNHLDLTSKAKMFDSLGGFVLNYGSQIFGPYHPPLTLFITVLFIVVVHCAFCLYFLNKSYQTLP